MSLPIILANSGVDLKGDLNGSANIVIYGPDGNPIRTVPRNGINDLGVVSMDRVNIINGLYSQSNLTANTTFRSPSIQMIANGYDVATFIIKISGTNTGVLAVGVFVEASLDGNIWFTSAICSFYILSPQNGIMKEGFVELRTPYPYLRLKFKTETIFPNGSINVDCIQSTKSNASTTLIAHDITSSVYGDGILDTTPDARGTYSTSFFGTGVNIANYIYLAVLNPSNSIINLMLEEIQFHHKYTGASRNIFGQVLQLCKITNINGGVSQPIQKLQPDYADPLGLVYITNPTVIVTDIYDSIYCTSAADGYVIESSNFSESTAVFCKPGEGFAFRTPVGLSNSDEVGFHITWRGMLA